MKERKLKYKKLNLTKILPLYNICIRTSLKNSPVDPPSGDKLHTRLVNTWELNYPDVGKTTSCDQIVLLIRSKYSYKIKYRRKRSVA